MATVNFSVPEEIKQTFNLAFAKENKSAILSGLMKQAIEEKKAKQRRSQAVDAILNFRSQQSCVTIDKISRAREELRK